MQAAAWAPPLHPNRRGRVSYRLSLPGLHLLEFRLGQVSRLQEGRLERLNQDLVLFPVRLGIRRKILPLIPNPMSGQCRHPARSSALRTADLVNRLALATGSDHAPGET
jgi:hypothetical protein